MAQVSPLADTLVLKGGTALRKFYYSTYPFSEDLVFSAAAPLQDGDSYIDAAVKLYRFISGNGTRT
jgi:predicted nucleotidyltransferase component of viral defense system